MANTYTIQFRRGMYSDFDTSKIRPGEPVAILGNDPSVPSGKALYIAFAANDVRRLCSIEDISEMVNAGKFVGPQGPKGEKGEKGAEGPTGPQGPKGEKGDKGVDGTVAFESLTPEQKESLRGISIKSASVDTDGNLTITFSDGNSEDIGNIMGPQGIQGPKGDKGDVGPQGPKGDKGDAGPKGDNMSDEQAAQIEQNKKDVNLLKEDIGNKAPAIIKKTSGKTIIINDSSNLPIKTLSGTGKIIITGKNILDTEKKNEFIPFEAKAGTLFTLITNGELSDGGNIRFKGENDEDVWFAIDKGKTKVSAKIGSNVKGYINLLSLKEGLKYCFSVGENDEYEEHVEQVITAPVDSEQLKAIHTNYPTTILTSENEISVEYVVDTEAYIEKRIKEENQSLQKQILEIQKRFN